MFHTIFDGWDPEAIAIATLGWSLWLTPGQINGNFRILKWRYVSTIFQAIFFGDISLHRPYIGLICGRYLQFRFLKWSKGGWFFRNAQLPTHHPLHFFGWQVSRMRSDDWWNFPWWLVSLHQPQTSKKKHQPVFPFENDIPIKTHNSRFFQCFYAR